MVLYVVGILLLIAEIFLPTFGIVGVLGIISVIAGVIIYSHDVLSAVIAICVVLVIIAAALFIAAKVLNRKGIWNKFILREALTTEKGYVAHSSREHLIGMTGTALSPLRPAGAAEIGGERIDVVTSGEFIPAGSRVIVVRLDGPGVVVKQVSEPR